MRRVVVGAFLVMLAGCGWKTADEANGTGGNTTSSVFTNSTTVTTVAGTVTTTVRPAGSFVSSTSANGAAPFTTTTSSGTFITDGQLVVPAETVVTLETVTDTTATPSHQQLLRAGGKTVAVTSIVAWTPGLNPGQSLTLTSGQSINVPSGTTVSTLDGGFITVNGHHNPFSTSAGAIVTAPVTATGAADNTVTAL